MSKEEILKKCITGYRGSIKRSDALQAMDTYAQEIAVGFAEEMERLKEEDGYEYQGDGTWLYDEGFAKKYITTPQLFQQFLTNKNEKK